MKRYLVLLLVPLLLVACDFDDLPEFRFQTEKRNYRIDMRNLVRDISTYARDIEEDFIVVPQGGTGLVTSDGRSTGTIQEAYLEAVNGLGVEGLFFGAQNVDQPTPDEESQRLRDLLDLAVDNASITVLVTDFANSQRNIDEAYRLIEDAGFTGFVAPNRQLDSIPDYPAEIPGLNRRDIDTLAQARNFLHLTNPRLYSTRQELIDALAATDYDLLILDFFFNGQPYTAAQLQQLQLKPDGGRRLLLAYMSIGQAESNRFYWQNSWPTNPPTWLVEEVAGNPGNYHVRYWEDGWRDILFGSGDDYLDRILDSAFDGVYLDYVDEYEFFEAE
ncbi:MULTISPECIES: endo alpha-1,4 polygalactosaminidase [unclassified Microbulbifer]|uniref:endo alpha-1,4 polygalactosaminidase n=1 Tax=unclassified Microbulbifer TaxID=2619833 RepID=UPI001E59D2E2|nr:endo alpha-1,4 polygalactosaminidase [Microbulbifer sp. YPW16]UHQ55578.1 endo alpha-1,4 polygalactosaminidase [Microbulbifer sp. YPW16]